MGNFMWIILILQLVFSAITAVYFFTMLRSQNSNRSALEKESSKQLMKFKCLQDVKLTVPLAEITRPSQLNEIVGQENGLKALRAAICCPNPQHVIIYGPPGVGKTAAARVVLKEAKENPKTPFKKAAKYVEIDAATLRFDDRGIADPLIGSVHDPIYQGAGSYGPAGIPQPKPGAVTKAHGGILFIDEIGELHPIQMNKLLKVLEDRKVFLESAYYSSEDTNIPPHIHAMFKDGLPADFRLVAATTRNPEEIPPAIRSRCVEIYFNQLEDTDIITIAENTAARGNIKLEDGVTRLIAKYARNGRECVSMVQTASSVAILEDRYTVTVKDMEWVIESGRYSPKLSKKVEEGSDVGIINGLAVYGASFGTVMDIEATAEPCQPGKGTLTVTGIVENEELDNRGQKLIKKSSASASIDNMLTVLQKHYKINIQDYHIHVNFPGGTPVDGPSAGIAIVCAVYSAIYNIPLSHTIAMTGEISIKGIVKPVGGVVAKVEAAKKAGIKTVYIPKENDCRTFDDMDITVIGVDTIWTLFEQVFGIESNAVQGNSTLIDGTDVIVADGI